VTSRRVGLRRAAAGYLVAVGVLVVFLGAASAQQYPVDTIPTTTTQVSPTTVVAGPTTTTTLAPTTTTQAPSVTTTTQAPAVSPTSQVAGEQITRPAPAGAPFLPVTGGDLVALIVIGAGVIVAGAILLASRARRTSEAGR
jgi:uncharacterized surface anchored protein